jgi:hypothetical protein
VTSVGAISAAALFAGRTSCDGTLSFDNCLGISDCRDPQEQLLLCALECCL